MEHNLSQYKIFYTVAEESNISKAADRLYISQPAISKAIKKLEDALGIILFYRNSRGVQLTEEGSLLYAYVKTAFDSLSLGEERLRQITELGIGHIRIGVSTALCKYLLLPYLQKFIRQHPHIRISIECQSTNHTLQLLKNGQVDIGLIGKPESLGTLVFHSLGEIEDIFVATKDYIDNLNLRSNTSNQNIFHSATLMLLDKGNITRQYIDDYLQENHISSNNLLEITTMDLLIEFSKISLGIACVIREFVKNELESGELLEIPLNVPIHKREVGFAYQLAGQQNDAVKKFIALYESTIYP